MKGQNKKQKTAPETEKEARKALLPAGQSHI